MIRTLHAEVDLDAPARTHYALAISAASGVPVTREALEVRLDGVPVVPTELRDAAGTRLQLFDADAGRLTIRYDAVITGRAAPVAVTALDREEYLRPSRYVPSDALQPLARETFSGLSGMPLVAAVDAWVHERLTYTATATTPTGGAAETLAAGAGVCRDFAHVTAAMLRALDVPARMVGVYAPQLDPMDFHAVVEAEVDGRWVVVDSTHLAPRAGLVRMTTGRDAADTAWLSNTLSDIQLVRLAVDATCDEVLDEDHTSPVELG